MLQVNIAAVHNAWAAKHPEQAHSKLSTFLDLSMELAAPYADLRAPERVDLDEAEQFWALTGESPESLREGRLLTARVMWVQPELAGLKTDSGALRRCARRAFVPPPRGGSRLGVCWLAAARGGAEQQERGRT